MRNAGLEEAQPGLKLKIRVGLAVRVAAGNLAFSLKSE